MDIGQQLPNIFMIKKTADIRYKLNDDTRNGDVSITKIFGVQIFIHKLLVSLTHENNVSTFLSVSLSSPICRKKPLKDEGLEDVSDRLTLQSYLLLYLDP